MCLKLKMKKLNMINSRLTFIFLSVLFLFPFSISAQSVEEIQEQMDKIKLDEKMIYGEDFNTNKNEAFDNALAELLLTANELRDEKELPPLTVSDLITFVKELQYTQGDRTISFVYIPLDKMYSLTPKAGSETRISNLSQNSDYPSQTSQEGEIEKQTGFVPNKPNKPTPASNSTSSAPSNFNAPAVNGDVIEIISQQDNWTEIKGLLSSFKQQGKIKETGYVTESAEIPEDAYSILIDEMYGVLAILSPRNSSKRINYKTNKTDSESNYNNCKVIVWYR